MKKKENHNTEFKQSWHDDYLKMLCAFANTDGGIMYVGKDDSGAVKGIANVKKLLEDVPSKIVNTLGFVPEVKHSAQGKKDFLSIKVKPLKSPVSLRGKFYVRSGSTTQELKGVQLQKFLLEKSSGTWESVIEEGATLKDIDEKTITHFKELSSKRFPIASKEKSISRLLEKLHLLHKGKLTRAALLLFGKDPLRYFISAQIRIGRFVSDTDLKSTDVAEGNLFRQVEQALEILKNKYLIFNARIEGLYRKEELEYPEEALREAIINAVIHKDYTGPHIQLRVYSDKLLLWNSGELPAELSVERLKKHHRSIPRNKLIADVFYKAGLIEAWGRGTIKIIEECKKAGLPEPLYEQEDGGVSVTFRKDIYTAETLQKMALNERQVKAVLYVKEHGRIVNSIYQKINTTTKKTATRDLAGLLNKGILKNIGGGTKGAVYVLKK